MDNNEKAIEKLIEQKCRLILDGKLGIVEASMQLGMYKQTFHEKLVEYINGTDDMELKRKYITYQEERNPDYSFINFKALFIEMVNEEVSQSELAKRYGIPARTVSRELEKLKNEKGYETLYAMAKVMSDRMMKRQEFSDYERFLMQANLDGFDEGPVIVNNSMTKEEREYRRAKELIKKAEQMDGFQVEIAQKLGVGVSTLRRARKRIEEYEKKEEMKKELEKEGENR